MQNVLNLLTSTNMSLVFKVSVTQSNSFYNNEGTPMYNTNKTHTSVNIQVVAVANDDLDSMYTVRGISCDYFANDEDFYARCNSNDEAEIAEIFAHMLISKGYVKHVDVKTIVICLKHINNWETV